MKLLIVVVEFYLTYVGFDEEPDSAMLKRPLH